MDQTDEEEENEGRRLPHITLILPVQTTPRQARAHAQARLTGPLENFQIRTIALMSIGEHKTRYGPVYGKRFMAVLEEIPDEEDGEVVYVHPDYHNFLKH